MSLPSDFAHAALLCALFAGIATPTANAADPCDAVYNAGIRSIQTPHHVYSTTTRRGKAESGEAIFDGNTEYMRLHGAWKRSSMTQREMLAIAQEKRKAHADTCTAAGGQAVDGQRVSVYKVHNNELGTDQLVRVFESSGLIQGGTLTLPDGTGVETRYEYTHVQAPTGVQ